ncbi:hypothetical protein cypCar_00018227 [Cyprinus carpio]|nr:hypothetical protein cypCar_00018227 [Cyprinus carpio]
MIVQLSSARKEVNKATLNSGILLMSNEEQHSTTTKANLCEELEDKDAASKMSLNEKMEKRYTAPSPEPSCVSLKSNASIVMPPNISDEAVTSDPSLKKPKTTSPEPSCVSMKSQAFLLKPSDLSFGAVTSDLSTMETLKVIVPMHNLLKGAVDEATERENGRLDLFLRFLLGVSLESNQRLLQDLLMHTENSSESIRKTTQYIKEKIKGGQGLSTERSINLFLCLLEVKDQTLSREIQEFVKSDKQSEKKISPAHCSTISYMLQMSEEPLDELDLKKYNTSDEGRRRLIPAVINCRKAIFAGSNIFDQDCEIVSSVLQSSNCILRELDLSNNDLQDSGVKLLSDGLKSPNCQLEKLRLSGCMVTEEGCGYLSSALRSNPSHLRELDLSYNHPGQSGVQLLNHKLEDPNYKLEKLSLNHGGNFRITPGLRKYACDLTLDPNTVNTQLMLSDENRKVMHMKTPQSYPDLPARFDTYPQVLCGESLTERCYWEVEWTGRVTGIAVTYKGISRKGVSDCVFGWNEKSWSLFCSDNSYTVCHNNDRTDLIAPSPPSNRVGVYLDWSAGTLSFYSISDQTLTHLHTFNTTFTEPLYAGFRVYEASVSLRNISTVYL